MTHQELYEFWSRNPRLDPDLLEELAAIREQQKEIYERFYKDLEFGTGGLRGIIGAGNNRMNVYTVRRVSQGIAEFLLGRSEAPQVAVSYDSRIKSDLFAREAACVFAANGVKCHIFPRLMPTPVLSYAVRALGCRAGAMITASHNPPEYNGYKVYGPDGGQLGTQESAAVIARINGIDLFEGVRTMDFEAGLKAGLIGYIPDSVFERYLDEVLACSVYPGIVEGSGLKVVFTPLHGTGGMPVTRMFKRLGLADFVAVPEQAEPDGRFPTCPYPNPEDRAALALGIELAQREGADLVVATDPDADRMGAAVREGGDYRLLSGNEMGVLLLDYIASGLLAQGKLPERPVLVKSLVSTAMAGAVAAHYGVEEWEVLPGFKFIGEKIGELEQAGEERRFILGFEESYGYLTGRHVRDKDAVNAAMMAVEMAAYHKRRGMTLAQAMEDLYRRFGSYADRVESFAFKGADGMRRMRDIMDTLADAPPRLIGQIPVETLCDYRRRRRVGTGGEEKLGLPASDMVSFLLQGGARVLVRPSGTEPKLKVYYSARGRDMEEALAVYGRLSADMPRIIGL